MNKIELLKEIETLKKEGRSIGFVPTMGALHEGHLSLIKTANKENDVTIVSIFVNPTQFNNKDDYNKYPRIFDEDIKKLEAVKYDILYTPTEEEMYPEVDNREFDFGRLDKVMEGKHRPGHFRGVALIVSKLFEDVKPDRAYFGEKDFQQVAIIRQLIKILDFNIDIVSCPIFREKDGLAMSSRNMLLNKEQRGNVSLISQTLFKIREQLKTMSVSETKDCVIRTINANNFLEVEYFDIVETNSLESINILSDKKSCIGCIAVNVGSIRLIDNVRIYS